MTNTTPVTPTHYPPQYPAERPDNEALLKLYLGIAVKAMREHGAIVAEVEYSGGGDEGNVDTVTLYGVDNALMDEKLLERVGVPFWDQKMKNGAWESVLNIRQITLNELLSWMIHDLALEFYDHNGYWNNEGGYGTLTISTEGSGELTLDHNDYVQETVSRTNSMAL
ncbi:MAG: hypothetical protein KGL39_21600 [Patescibacteria group bacterium]|nr:hypothetical protein [Patescibacteria group bacterium]